MPPLQASFAPPLPVALTAAAVLLGLPLALLAHWVAVAERGGQASGVAVGRPRSIQARQPPSSEATFV